MNRVETSAFAAIVAMLLMQAPTVARGENAAFLPFAHPEASYFTYNVGARYWYGRGKTAKDLYGTSTALQVSRLSYDDFNIHSAEIYLRGDHSSGWFVKGYGGFAGFASGKLVDEDFPPVVSPYSSTDSALRDSTLGYASVDLGYKVVKGGDFNVGAFAGFHYMNEQVSAVGCVQTAGNASICGTPIPETVKVISQSNNWRSLRVGLDAHVDFNERFRLSLEGAWLPYVWMSGQDTHWLRIGVPGGFTGPLPEDGTGWGYQFEGLLSYRVTDLFSIGIGGRYWRMESTRGHTHFEGHVVGGGGAAQELRWSADEYGIFVQGSIKLGPYKAGMN